MPQATCLFCFNFLWDFQRCLRSKFEMWLLQRVKATAEAASFRSLEEKTGPEFGRLAVEDIYKQRKPHSYSGLSPAYTHPDLCLVPHLAIICRRKYNKEESSSATLSNRSVLGSKALCRQEQFGGIWEDTLIIYSKCTFLLSCLGKDSHDCRGGSSSSNQEWAYIESWPVHCLCCDQQFQQTHTLLREELSFCFLTRNMREIIRSQPHRMLWIGWDLYRWSHFKTPSQAGTHSTRPAYSKPHPT